MSPAFCVNCLNFRYGTKMLSQTSVNNYLLCVTSQKSDDLIYSAAEAGNNDTIVIMDGRSTIFEQPVPFPNIMRFQYVITISLTQQAVNYDGRDSFHPVKTESHTNFV